jgi:hypothetical protein
MPIIWKKIPSHHFSGLAIILDILHHPTSSSIACSLSKNEIHCTSVSWPSLPPSPVIHPLDGKKTKTSANIPSQAYSKPSFTQHTWIRMSQECLGGTVIGNTDWTYVEVIVGPILAPQFDDLLRVLSLKLQHDKGITWHQATHYPLKCNNATWEIEAQLKGFWKKALRTFW